MTNCQKTLAALDIKPQTILDDITVVIPTLGRAILEECFYWIVAGSVWPRELIVVDQGSNPKVAGWSEKLNSIGIRAEYVPSTQLGRAAGINRGLERVTTRFVAITDDDCFVEIDWLKNMTAHLHDYPEAIVTGRIKSAGDEVAVVVTSLKPAVYHHPRLKFDAMSGGNMGTSLGVIERAGLFDEDVCLRTAEDAEWAYRALRVGVPIIYTPDVAVRHFGWRDKNKRAAQYQEYARSHGGFYGKYLRQGDGFIALRAVIHHLRALRRWLRGLMTGDEEAVLYGRAYVTGLLPGIIAGFRKQSSL